MKWYQIRFRFLVLFFLSLSILFGCYYFYRPQNDSLTEYKVKEKPFSEVWSHKKILLVGIGDSIITGYGSSDQAHSFFQMIIENPNDDSQSMKNINLKNVFPNLSQLNLAENSTSSGDHIFQVESLPMQPKDVYGIIILSTGGIDLIHDYGNSPPEEEAIYGANLKEIEKYSILFERRLNILTEKIKGKFPGGVKILIFSIYDPTDGIGDIENATPYLKLFKRLPKWEEGLFALTRWNQIIQNISREKSYVELVDLHKEFLGHGIHCQDKENPNYKPNNPYYWFYINLEDPNQNGYQAIRRLVLLKMVEVFYEKKALQN